MQVEVSPSQRKGEKFKAVVDGSRTIHFGSKGASDFTLHGSEVRKQRYISRHHKNEDWSDPTTAGFYAKHLLWNKPTLQGSIRDTNKRFQGIHIAYRSHP